jgi:hypothetical protein
MTVEALLPSTPAEWPRWARRAFLLAAPVAVPLWLLWWAAWVFGIVAFGVVAALVYVAVWALAPVVAIMWSLGTTIGDLWCVPDAPTLRARVDAAPLGGGAEGAQTGNSGMNQEVHASLTGGKG